MALIVCVSFVNAQNASSGSSSVPLFGTTVISSGLRGEIYFIPPDTEWLPQFKRLKPVGTIYTTRLDVPPSNFTQGFPGVTGRYEWFAIDYRGRFWIEQNSRYRFGITSDDGSKLYIDDHLIIDDDGQHPPSGCAALVELGRGIHSLRVSYFQGPRFGVALILVVARETERWHIFDTRDFTPPSDSPAWNSDASPRPKQYVRRLKGGTCWAQ